MSRRIETDQFENFRRAYMRSTVAYQDYVTREFDSLEEVAEYIYIRYAASGHRSEILRSKFASADWKSHLQMAKDMIRIERLDLFLEKLAMLLEVHIIADLHSGFLQAGNEGQNQVYLRLVLVNPLKSVYLVTLKSQQWRILSERYPFDASKYPFPTSNPIYKARLKKVVDIHHLVSKPSEYEADLYTWLAETMAHFTFHDAHLETRFPPVVAADQAAHYAILRPEEVYNAKHLSAAGDFLEIFREIQPGQLPAGAPRAKTLARHESHENEMYRIGKLVQNYAHQLGFDLFEEEDAIEDFADVAISRIDMQVLDYVLLNSHFVMEFRKYKHVAAMIYYDIDNNTVHLYVPRFASEERMTQILGGVFFTNPATRLINVATRGFGIEGIRSVTYDPDLAAMMTQQLLLHKVFDALHATVELNYIPLGRGLRLQHDIQTPEEPLDATEESVFGNNDNAYQTYRLIRKTVLLIKSLLFPQVLNITFTVQSDARLTNVLPTFNESSLGEVIDLAGRAAMHICLTNGMINQLFRIQGIMTALRRLEVEDPMLFFLKQTAPDVFESANSLQISAAARFIIVVYKDIYEFLDWWRTTLINFATENYTNRHRILYYQYEKETDLLRLPIELRRHIMIVRTVRMSDFLGDYELPSSRTEAVKTEYSDAAYNAAMRQIRLQNFFTVYRYINDVSLGPELSRFTRQIWNQMLRKKYALATESAQPTVLPLHKRFIAFITGVEPKHGFKLTEFHIDRENAQILISFLNELYRENILKSTFLTVEIQQAIPGGVNSQEEKQKAYTEETKEELKHAIENVSEAEWRRHRIEFAFESDRLASYAKKERKKIRKLRELELEENQQRAPQYKHKFKTIDPERIETIEEISERKQLIAAIFETEPEEAESIEESESLAEEGLAELAEQMEGIFTVEEVPEKPKIQQVQERLAELAIESEEEIDISIIQSDESISLGAETVILTEPAEVIIIEDDVTVLAKDATGVDTDNKPVVILSGSPVKIGQPVNLATQQPIVSETENPVNLATQETRDEQAFYAHVHTSTGAIKPIYQKGEWYAKIMATHNHTEEQAAMAQSVYEYVGTTQAHVVEAVPIMLSDFNTLFGTSWIDDAIIGAYFGQVTQCARTSYNKRIFSADPLWSQYDDRRVARSARLMRDKMFGETTANAEPGVYTVLIPLNTHQGTHWILIEATVNFRRGQLLLSVYDSMLNTKRIPQRQAYTDIIKNAHAVKVLLQLITAHSNHTPDPEVKFVQVTRQRNKYDCGLYVMMIAKKCIADEFVTFASVNRGPTYRLAILVELTNRLIFTRLGDYAQYVPVA